MCPIEIGTPEVAVPIEIPPVVSVVSIVISSDASISNVVESISIGLSAFVPIPIEVAESIVRAPLASISKVLASISIAVSAATPISIPPAPSIATLPLFDASISTPVCPSNVKLPASEFISIPPTEVLIFVAPSTSIDKVEVPSMVIAPLASISKVEESISIATSDSTPISIPPLPSIVTLPPSASISIAPADCKVILPLVVLLIVRLPLSIVKLELPTPSKEIVDVESKVTAPLASISNVVESISIGLSVVVPMFIPVSESILNAPDDEIAVVDSPLIVIAPLESISNVDDSTLNGLSIAVPIWIPSTCEESIVIFPVASKSNLAEWISSKTSCSFPILIEVSESIDKSPDDDNAKVDALELT